MLKTSIPIALAATFPLSAQATVENPLEILVAYPDAATGEFGPAVAADQSNLSSFRLQLDGFHGFWTTLQAHVSFSLDDTLAQNDPGVDLSWLTTLDAMQQLTEPTASELLLPRTLMQFMPDDGAVATLGVPLSKLQAIVSEIYGPQGEWIHCQQLLDPWGATSNSSPSYWPVSQNWMGGADAWELVPDPQPSTQWLWETSLDPSAAEFGQDSTVFSWDSLFFNQMVLQVTDKDARTALCKALAENEAEIVFQVDLEAFGFSTNLNGAPDLDKDDENPLRIRSGRRRISGVVTRHPILAQTAATNVGAAFSGVVDAPMVLPGHCILVLNSRGQTVEIDGDILSSQLIRFEDPGVTGTVVGVFTRDPFGVYHPVTFVSNPFE